ncbi:MAG TPA: hypothetical protein VKW08_03910 [Xanthobacteraceae bacterium]|nr:hypothetical protein [Xanthobacteraceae bacterium]
MLLQIGAVQRETTALLAHKLRDRRSVDVMTIEKGQQPAQWDLAQESFDMSAIARRYPPCTDHFGQASTVYAIGERHIHAGHQQVVRVRLRNHAM